MIEKGRTCPKHFNKFCELAIGPRGQAFFFLESPMSDGTIEEDFEEAIVKEVAAAGELVSPETTMVSSIAFEGKVAKKKFTMAKVQSS